MNYKRINEFIEITINEITNRSVHDFFMFYRLSKKHIHELRISKNVFLNGELVNQNFHIVLNQNDVLRFPFFIHEKIDFIPQNIPIDIIYEDDFMLVVDKQPGIEVHPDKKDGINTLVNGVAYYYLQTNQPYRIRYIHRLDRDTTGAIIFAKQYFVHNLFDSLLSNKEIKRYYIAIVKGRLLTQSGSINQPIGRDRHHNQKRVVSKSGDIALTHYRVLKVYSDYTVIELELFTGRTHQIRVHMSYLNHPLLGDTLYGTTSPIITRQALHAYRVKLVHPITLESFTIDVPIPSDMKKLIE